MSWPLVPLREVVELVYGRALPAEDRSPDGVVPVFGANGVKAFTDQALHNEATIIVGRKGSVGELVRCEGPSWALDVAYYTIPDSTRVDQDYLYYWLTTADLPSLAKGVKPGLNRNEVYAKDLPLPPLDDQARIVGLLDEATDALSALERVYAQTTSKLTDLRSSALAAAMAGQEWPLVPLGDLCEVLDSRRQPITKKDRVAGEVPYYGASGVVDWVANHIFDEPLVLLGEDGAKWEAGDRSAFRIEGKSWVNNHAHVLRPSRDRILDGWLVSCLVAADLSDFITGLTVPKLNQGRMKEIPVPLPPLEDQARIVSLLDDVSAAADEALELASTRLEAANGLRQSILESAFRGEL